MLGTNKVFICLWLVMLFALSSEEMRSEGCNTGVSKTWNHKVCFKHGTCNRPCTAEGYDSGSCYLINVCVCQKNCGLAPAPDAPEVKRWNKIV